MKIIKVCSIIICGFVFSSSFAGCLDPEEAKAVYLRSKGQTPADAAHLLQRSIVLCESYEAYYGLGENQQELKQYQLSLESFKRAQLLEEEDAQKKANTLARMAESYMKLEDLPNALEAMKLAEKLYKSESLEKPGWVKYVKKDIDKEEYKIRPKPRPQIAIEILFDSQSMAVNKVGLAKAKQLGLILLPYVKAGKKVLIVGHSEKSGNQSSNVQISEDRAKSVVKVLENLYPELVGKLQYEGRGFSQLRYSGVDKNMNALNRRVDVEIQD